MCWQRFIGTMLGDCGTDSYDAVFTARILAVKQVPVPARGGQEEASALDATIANDLDLTIWPEEAFKGHPPDEMQIFAEQGECFPEARVGDDWLFFTKKSEKEGELEISYDSSNPSGPVEQRLDYIERLRRLARGDGLSYVTGEVDFPSFDFSKGDLLNPQPNHRLVMESKDEERSYSVSTDDKGKFQLGPVPPGSYSIDANTNPQFRDPREGFTSFEHTEANGCSFVRIELEINSEISGRVILPEGYKYKPSDIGNLFPLFTVDVDSVDGKQARGSSIGDGLRFTVTGLPPGSYNVVLVNWSNEDWLKMPVYAPGVTDKSIALRIDLGLAEHKTGLEIRVPPEALKTAKEAPHAP